MRIVKAIACSFVRVIHYTVASEANLKWGGYLKLIELRSYNCFAGPTRGTAVADPAFTKGGV